MARVVEHRVSATLNGDIGSIQAEVGQAHRVVVVGPTVHRPTQPLGCPIASGLVVPGPWMEDRHPIPFILAAIHEAARLDDPVVLIVGHVARDEKPELGKARADGLRCLMQNDADGWVEIATETGSIQEVKGYLSYLNAMLGWECWVQAIDRADDAATAESVEAFQAEYNAKFKRDIVVDGVCGEETLGALFEVCRFEWDKWPYKHNVTQEQVDSVEFHFDSGTTVYPGAPGLAAVAGSPCVDALVVERKDLGAQPSATLVLGSKLAKYVTYEIPIEPWAWERGPFTVITDLVEGEVLARETYTVRSTDGSFELSQTLPDDAVDLGLLAVRFLAMPCDRSYDLSVTIEGRDTYVLFEGIPYNQLHRIAVEGTADA